MISSVSSQQRLNDSTVIVPIKSLRNALLVKTERDNLKKELTTARDSITTMNKIIFRQDTALYVCDSTRIILDKKVKDYEEVVKAKNGIIEEKDKKLLSLNKTIKKLIGAVVLTSLGFIISIL